MKTCVLLALLLLVPAAVQGEEDPLAALEQQIESGESRGDHEHGHPHHLAPPGAEEVPTFVHERPVPHEHRHLPAQRHSWLEAFSFEFMQRATVAGLLAGTICTWLGLFVVLRRLVFVAIALAQVASAGIALGVLLGFQPTALGMLSAVAASIASGSKRLRGRLPGEAHMGLFYLGAGALAILFLARSGTGEAEQLEMLNGNLIVVRETQLWTLGLAALGIGLLHISGFRQLVAISFDPVSGIVAGVRVWAWDALFFLALGLGIGVSIQSCGLLLVFGYVVIPASAGLLTGFRLPGVLAVAMGVQALATVAGLWVAYEGDLPGGPCIVTVMLICLVVIRLAASFRTR